MTRSLDTAPAGREFLLRSLHSPQRWALAGAAAVAAGAHVPVIASHLDQAPYMGVLFVLLTAACVALAACALIRDSAGVYALAALTCGLAIIGYVATRLVPFPMLSDDVGNWLEPLGVVSILSEASALAAAMVALVLRRPARGTRPR